MSAPLKLAAVAWKLRDIRTDGKFFSHFHDLVSHAHDAGADVVVFPELIVLELLGLERELADHKVAEYLVQFEDAFEEWIRRIASNSAMTLVAGSHFKRLPDGTIGNACAVATPDGRLVVNWKNKLTDYERRVWRLAPGSGLKRLQDFRLGTLVCYDSEFPESARNLAEEGVELLMVPAFTETQRGFQRVRWCCQARATENQIFVAHASLVGSLEREPVPETCGNSAILCPSIEPFPESALLAQTEPNEEGVAIAEIDFQSLHTSRNRGDVRNWHDRYPSDWTVS